MKQEIIALVASSLVTSVTFAAKDKIQIESQGYQFEYQTQSQPRRSTLVNDALDTLADRKKIPVDSIAEPAEKEVASNP